MQVNQSLCDVCGTCASVCPVSAIRVKEFEIVFDNDKCIHCRKCLRVCPLEAIQEEK